MNSHYTPIKRNDIDNQLFTFNWPAVITLIVNTITQSGASEYTQSVHSVAYLDTITYVEVIFHSQHFFSYISLHFNSVYVENG